jgi:hypothetical protein
MIILEQKSVKKRNCFSNLIKLYKYLKPFLAIKTVLKEFNMVWCLSEWERGPAGSRERKIYVLIVFIGLMFNCLQRVV